MNYLYQGELSSSKSIFNRALIVQSFFPQVQVHGNSQSEDVAELKNALTSFHQKSQNIYAGLGGTSFRFLLGRLSREAAEFQLEASPSLADRPHQGLLKSLEDLGVRIERQKNFFKIESQGWKDPRRVLQMDSDQSSQFASSIVLNAWDLDFDLSLNYREGSLSESYFQLTIEFLKRLGMKVIKNGSVYTIPKNQKISQTEIHVEMDISSAFSLSAFAYFGEPVRLHNFPFESLQPDLVYLDFFRQMGFEVRKEGFDLIVQATGPLRGFQADLSQSPDLFPVLASLCACAEGVSELVGAEQLVYKESNRLEGVMSLFDLCQIRFEKRPSGLRIYGKNPLKTEIDSKIVVFDPRHDHRMAMAAAFLKKAGYPLQIIHSNVVNKSFSDFWRLVRIEP